VAGLSSWQRARKAESLAQDLQQQDDYQAYKSMKKLVALGPAGAEKVLPLLRSSDGAVRGRALMVIAETGAEGYTGLAERFLQDPAPEARTAAAVAAGCLDNKGAVGKLITLLDDPRQPVGVRIAATRSLARLGLPEALKSLRAALALPATKDNAPLRQAAMLALGAIATPEAVTQVAASLAPTRKRTRRSGRWPRKACPAPTPRGRRPRTWRARRCSAASTIRPPRCASPAPTA